MTRAALLTTSVVLTVLGLLVPIGAVVWGWFRVKREVDDLSDKMNRALALGAEWDAADHEGKQEVTRRQYEILQPAATFGELTYIFEKIRIELGRAEMRQLKWPAIWAGIGLFMSTVGSLIGLFIPPD